MADKVRQHAADYLRGVGEPSILHGDEGDQRKNLVSSGS
jgi:hypothetical protein